MRPDTHEIYARRNSRNRALALVMGAFVVMIIAVTMVKVSNGNMMEGFDHQPRSSLGIKAP